MSASPLGDGYNLSLAPRRSFYVGDRSDNPDIRRYRGNTGLFMEVGEDEGLRLSTSTRFDFRSGKGAISADISYPLRRILGGGPDFYLFGQSFVGYGENLLDYNRRMSRLRIRSEEHTSELQSLMRISYAVFCLKKQKTH